MARSTQSPSAESRSLSTADRLDSWKEISAYFNRSVRTVRRWEVEQGLPVHRHLHQSAGTIYAFKSELDAWFTSRGAELESSAEVVHETSETTETRPERRRVSLAWLITAVVAAVAGLLVYAGVHRFGRKTSAPGRVMLAVLPLDNLSREPGQDYVSEGLTEEVITELGRLNPQRLGVIARTSVMRYQKTKLGIDEIGRELHVDYVLEGSIRKDAEQVRIAIQLIRVNDQTHLWAERYDRNSRDMLALQAEVAEAVGRAIEVRFAPDSKTRHEGMAAVDPEAHDAYLMGRYFWNRRTPEALTKAIAYFERALRLDPNYALAYAGLADCYAVLPNYGHISDREADLKAEMAATKALQIDPDLGEVYATLASVSLDRWEWAEAERTFRRAIDLRPNNATAHQWYAAFLQQVGRLDEAAAELKKAEELDPLSVIIKAVIANQLYFERQFDGAIAQTKKVLEMEPRLPSFQNHLGLIYAAKGMLPEAMTEFRKARELDPDDPMAIALLGSTHALSSQPGEARKALRELDVLAKRGKPRIAFFSAFVHISLGDKDRGFELLNQAIEEHTGPMVWLKSSPAFDILRSDPRYDLLLKRMNFPNN